MPGHEEAQNKALFPHCLSMPAFYSAMVAVSGSGDISGNACAYPPPEGKGRMAAALRAAALPD